MVENNYGVDLKSNFNFIDGDLELTTNEKNISQAVCNRINTPQDSLDYFYTDYGSIFVYFLGWKANNETLEFMKTEIRTTLLKDPRINDVNVETEYNKNGKVNVNINLNNTDEQLNFVINGDKIEPVEE